VNLGERANVKEHVLNLINALANLSPSRSIISQLILLLPEKPTVIEHSYPECSSHSVKAVMESLGVRFGDRVEREKNSFAEALYKYVHKTFDWLDNELLHWEYHSYGSGLTKIGDKMKEVRSSLAKLTETHIDSIPNPYLEWAKLVLKKLSSIYGQSKILGFLKELLTHDLFIDRDYERKSWQSFLNEVKTSIRANPAEFEEILKSAVKGGERERLCKGSGGYLDVYVFLEHSKYHLDPLIYEMYTYRDHRRSEYEYRVRHKEALKRALEEASK